MYGQSFRKTFAAFEGRVPLLERVEDASDVVSFEELEALDQVLTVGQAAGLTEDEVYDLLESDDGQLQELALGTLALGYGAYKLAKHALGGSRPHARGKRDRGVIGQALHAYKKHKEGEAKLAHKNQMRKLQQKAGAHAVKRAKYQAASAKLAYKQAKGLSAGTKKNKDSKKEKGSKLPAEPKWTKSLSKGHKRQLKAPKGAKAPPPGSPPGAPNAPSAIKARTAAKRAAKAQDARRREVHSKLAARAMKRGMKDRLKSGEGKKLPPFPQVTPPERVLGPQAKSKKKDDKGGDNKKQEWTGHVPVGLIQELRFIIEAENGLEQVLDHIGVSADAIAEADLSALVEVLEESEFQSDLVEILGGLKRFAQTIKAKAQSLVGKKKEEPAVQRKAARRQIVSKVHGRVASQIMTPQQRSKSIAKKADSLRAQVKPDPDRPRETHQEPQYRPASGPRQRTVVSGTADTVIKLKRKARPR